MLRNTSGLIVLLIFCLSCEENTAYLDSDFPGLQPKIYAKGIIDVEGRFQQNLTMSSDGTEHLITITDSAIWRYERIIRIKKLNNKIEVDTPNFVKEFKYQNEWFIGEPMISPDDESLFFIADYPPDIWKSKRLETGDWGTPKRIHTISTEKDDWYPSLSQNNSLYFTNGTLYRSKIREERYKTKEAINIPFPSKDIRDACISANEDYIIFTATDSLNYGKSDLYVSFKGEDGFWSRARNLGANVNTKYREFAPYISPDQKYLFFSRREQWQNASFSNVYWVSLDVIQ